MTDTSRPANADVDGDRLANTHDAVDLVISPGSNISTGERLSDGTDKWIIPNIGGGLIDAGTSPSKCLSEVPFIWASVCPTTSL